MKSVLITGGSGGIGRVLVQEAIEKDMFVINLDQKPWEFKHPNYQYIQLDLSNINQVQDCLKDLPVIDYLVLNAAISNNGPFTTMSVEDLQEVLNVNLVSHILLAQWYANTYDSKHGRIVFITSTRTKMSEPNTIPYTITKGALDSLTHALAITLQEKHITVNAIAPGWIHTTKELLRSIDHQFHPSNRVGVPQDISRMVFFLLEEASDYINGETFTIDGGVTKKMVYPE